MKCKAIHDQMPVIQSCNAQPSTSAHFPPTVTPSHPPLPPAAPASVVGISSFWGAPLSVWWCSQTLGSRKWDLNTSRTMQLKIFCLSSDSFLVWNVQIFRTVIFSRKMGLSQAPLCPGTPGRFPAAFLAACSPRPFARTLLAALIFSASAHAQCVELACFVLSSPLRIFGLTWCSVHL